MVLVVMAWFFNLVSAEVSFELWCTNGVCAGGSLKLVPPSPAAHSEPGTAPLLQRVNGVLCGATGDPSSCQPPGRAARRGTRHALLEK